MFRGFRWQLAILTLSLLIFAAAMFSRGSRSFPAPATSTPAAEPSATSTATPPPAATLPASQEASPAALEIVYREGLLGSVRRLNPVFAHLNAVDRDIASLIYEGLFASNDYGAPVPRLAERFVASRDGYELVVELRRDALWQDGLPFGADDVIYTMSLLADPAYAEFSDMSRFWSTLETQKLDEHTVRFRLAQPLASFQSLLTIGILPEHALRGINASQLARHPFNLSPIGTGPYQLRSLQADAGGQIREVRLQAAPVYAKRADRAGDYAIRDLSFRLYADAAAALEAYGRGEIDALANVGSRADLLSLPGSQVYSQLESSLTALIYNWEEPLFQDRRLRRSLALALDIPALISAQFSADATAADSPLIPGLAAYQPNAFWYAHDPDQARTLFSSAQATLAEKDDDDEATPESTTDAISAMTLLVEDAAPLPQLAEAIAAAWRGLGLELTVEAVPADQLLERLRAGDFAAAIVSQRIGGDADVYRYWHPSQAAAGHNYGGALNLEIAEALERARRELNGNARQQLYGIFQDKFAEQALGIPLYYPVTTLVARRTIAGIRLGYLGTLADRYRSIADWRMATLAS